MSEPISVQMSVKKLKELFQFTGELAQTIENAAFEPSMLPSIAEDARRHADFLAGWLIANNVELPDRCANDFGA